MCFTKYLIHINRLTLNQGRQTRQTNKADKQGRKIRQTNKPDKKGRQIRQTNKTGKHDRQTNTDKQGRQFVLQFIFKLRIFSKILNKTD